MELHAPERENADSALNTTRPRAGHQSTNFLHGDLIEVMLDRVLQAGSCHGEVNGILIGVVLRKSVNECAAEGVTAANTVNDLDIIAAGEAGFVSRCVLELSLIHI